MVKVDKKVVALGVAFTAGLAQELGKSITHEGYKIFEAIDPLYEVRRRLEEKKRKKIFNDIMAQTNLRAELT